MHDLTRAWSATAVGTSAGATATKAADTGTKWVVTHISGFNDQDHTLQLKDGSTVLAAWEFDISVSGTTFEIVGVWPCSANTAVTAVLVDSNSDCRVNMAGYAIGAADVTI
jgi:hypothetical protein